MPATLDRRDGDWVRARGLGQVTGTGSDHMDWVGLPGLGRSTGDCVRSQRLSDHRDWAHRDRELKSALRIF